MTGVWSGIESCLMRGECCALISVVSTSGSAPREAGARMLVFDDNTYQGTIGGGTLEWQALDSANSQIAGHATSASASVTKHVLGADLGQCCGGVVELLTEVFTPTDLTAIQQLNAWMSNGVTTTRAVVNADGVHRERIELAQGVSHDGESIQLISDDNELVLIEQHRPLCQDLYLFGAGHVGRALVFALATLPFKIAWVDERQSAFPTYLPNNASAMHVPDPVESLRNAPTNSMILVMTHSHQRDYELIEAALTANRFRYIGLIGSSSKRGRFSNRLRRLWNTQRINDDEIRHRLDCLTCPIGIDGISGKEPPMIAAATVAQLLQRIE